MATPNHTYQKSIYNDLIVDGTITALQLFPELTENQAQSLFFDAIFRASVASVILNRTHCSIVASSRLAREKLEIITPWQARVIVMNRINHLLDFKGTHHEK